MAFYKVVVNHQTHWVTSYVGRKLHWM